jgi:serine protease
MNLRCSIARESFLPVVLIAATATLGCTEVSESPLAPAPEDDPEVAAIALANTDHGNVFVANTFTPGAQSLFSASSCSNGDAVLLWWDAVRVNWFTRRYSAGGIPSQRDERLVDPVAPPVAGTGCFAIARNLPDGAGLGIYVEIFDRTGNVVIPEFRVNEATAGDQTNPRVAINASGQFVVTWQDLGARAIYVKLFQANGAAVAPTQLVFSTGVEVIDPHVAINNFGEFVVAWDVFTISSPTLYDVAFRRYSSTGFPTGPAFIANTTTIGVQIVPTPVISSAGDFWIIWESLPTLTVGPQDGWQVIGRRFSVSSTPMTGEIPISAVTRWSLAHSVGMAANGNFMVAWNDVNPSNLGQVLVRSISNSGTPFDAPSIVSTSSLSNDGPLVAMDADGNAVVAWNLSDATAMDRDIAVRRFPPAGITVQTIENGATVTDLSGAIGSWRYFKLSVPPGHNQIDVVIYGGTGDADLYVRRGAVPSATGWDGRPFLDGNDEGVEMLGFPPGDWFIAINGFAAYSSLTLQVASHE